MNSCLQFLRIKDYKEVRASVEIIRVFPGQKGCIVNEHKSRLCTLVCLTSVVWFSAPTSDTWQLAHLAGERPSLVLTNLFAHWDESGVLSHQTAAGAMATWKAQRPSSFESLMECFLLALIYITALSLLGLCGSVVPYSGFWDFLPSRVFGFLPLRWMLYSETVYCLL